MYSVGLTEIQVGVNGVKIKLDLHTKANTFAPNEYRGVVNPSGLVVYKGSNTRVESNSDSNRKVKRSK